MTNFYKPINQSTPEEDFSADKLKGINPMDSVKYPSLEGKSKKEVMSEITKVIFVNIRDIRKLRPLAKAGEATHVLGTYDFEEHVVKETLIPIDIKQNEGYLFHNAEILEEAKKTLAEIEKLNKQINPDNLSYMAIASDLIETVGITMKGDALDALSKKFAEKETPAVWRDVEKDTKLIKDWLDVDVTEDFFFLGNLKYVSSGYNLLNSPPSLEGSNEEKKKYTKLRKLSRYLTLLEVRTTYLKTFDISIDIQSVFFIFCLTFILFRAIYNTTKTKGGKVNV